MRISVREDINKNGCLARTSPRAELNAFLSLASGDRSGVRFEATGTIEKLIAGAFSGAFSRLQGIASPEGIDCLQTRISRWMPAA
jgi:hypothetical protein